MNTRQDQSPSFGSFITGQYIPNVKCFKRSWRTDESLLRIHVFPLLATRLIGQIDLTGIISVVCRMQEAGYSSGSINRVLAVLRQLDDNDLLNLFTAVGRVVSKRFLMKRPCLDQWQLVIDYLRSAMGFAPRE